MTHLYNDNILVLFWLHVRFQCFVYLFEGQTHIFVSRFDNMQPFAPPKIWHLNLL